MHVTKVELENIKAYERKEYAFERGTTAIVGPNGAGKTTILEAIAWALFDTLKYSKDDFLRRGAKKGSVRVTFQSDIDEREYMVYRDTGQGYYVYDPAIQMRVAEKKADVRSFLNMHLGVEPGTDLTALFESAIGVPQGLLTADFLKPASQRKAAFDRLLKVEEYREGAERLRDTVNLIRERVTEARVRIAGAESQLARYDELVGEHKTATARVEELSASIAELQREVEQRARTVGEMDAAEQRVTEMRARAERLDVEQSAAARRLQDLETELDAARRASERQRATEAAHRAHLAALEALRALETDRAERDRLSGESRAVARLIDRAEHDVRRLEESLERAAQARLSLVALESEIAAQEDLERERERLRDLLARARAAHERLTRLDRELSDLRAQHVQTRERVRAAQSASGAPEKVEQLESERVEVETRLSKIEKDLTARKHLDNQRKEQAREVERVRRSVAALERETGKLEVSAHGAARAVELEARERELAQQAARLRAAIERDEKIRADAKGGLCPIMGERCTSFNEGQTFEGYFSEHLAANRAELTTVEAESVRVVEAVRAARVASTAAASAADALTDDIKQIETRLRALKDPRGRAVAVRAEAEREEALKTETVGARDALGALTEQSRALDAQLARFVELDARWSSVVAERERTAEAYREFLESASLAATLPAREAEAKAARELAARAATDAEAARAEYASAVAAYDRERHGDERARLTLARERAAAAAAQLEAARDNEAKLASEIARLDEVRASLRDEFRAKERLEELHEATDFVRDVLKQAGPLVTESYLYNITIEANQLFREITGEGGRALRWSRDYEIMLEEGGHERAFVNLSGGEQMVAALSVRLALLKQLSDIRVAFFDEPTVNMDTERRERLAQQIGQVTHFDQLFVISHDDTFEESVDHVVAVTRTTGEAA